MQYFLKALFDFNNRTGRSRRKEFWYFVLYSAIIIVLWIYLCKGIACCFKDFFHSRDYVEYYQFPFLRIFLYSFLILLYPLLWVTERHFHDCGVSFCGIFALGIFFLFPYLILIAFFSDYAIDFFVYGLKFFGTGTLITHLISGLSPFFSRLIFEYGLKAYFLMLLLPLCYYPFKKGTKGDNMFGPDPRLNDSIEMAQMNKKYRKKSKHINSAP